jgi:hypothetical protein
MAQATLTTVDLLKRDLPMLKDTPVGEAELQNNIDDAIDVVYDDLSKFVDWDEVEALSAVPRVLQRLGRYQAAMLTIIRNFHSDETMIGSGEGENSVYNHYKGLYTKLLEQISSGDIRILDADNEELEPEVHRPLGPGRII